jgi:hypothetical protein
MAREEAHAADGRAPSGETDTELRALLGVVRGLRALAEGRLSGLTIAPGEYLADIYCIQRVAALLAMELAAAGRSLRREQTKPAEAEVYAIEQILAVALARRGVELDDCVLDLADVRVTRRDRSPV